MHRIRKEVNYVRQVEGEKDGIVRKVDIQVLVRGIYVDNIVRSLMGIGIEGIPISIRKGSLKSQEENDKGTLVQDGNTENKVP